LFKPECVERLERRSEAHEPHSTIEAKDETGWAKVAVADADLGGGIESTTDIDSDDQGLRRSETTTAVEKFPQ
jgi:hypothetical protein